LLPSVQKTRRVMLDFYLGFSTSFLRPPPPREESLLFLTLFFVGYHFQLRGSRHPNNIFRETTHLTRSGRYLFLSLQVILFIFRPGLLPNGCTTWLVVPFLGPFVASFRQPFVFAVLVIIIAPRPQRKWYFFFIFRFVRHPTNPFGVLSFVSLRFLFFSGALWETPPGEILADNKTRFSRPVRPCVPEADLLFCFFDQTVCRGLFFPRCNLSGRFFL